MASAGLRAELDCSVCLNIYTDPVNLTCGHNFCRVCIERVLDSQVGSGGYSCPECREEFRDRPALYMNITLRNIIENFRSSQPDQEESIVCCTHCVDSPVPAVRSCLHCEAALCDKHVRVHNKSPEHILCDPATSLDNRKCSIHKKILEYYCCVDGACICLACRMDGIHNGHKAKMLPAASEMRKEKLKSFQKKLTTNQKEAVRTIHGLQEQKKKAIEKAEEEKRKTTALLGKLRSRLDDLEKRVLGEISGQAQRVSNTITNLIRELEIKKEERTRKMDLIEELCTMADLLITLQKSGSGDLCDTEDEDNLERRDELWGLDVGRISHILHTGLSDIMTGLSEKMEETEDLLLDVTTAGAKLRISEDRRTVTALPSPDKSLPDTPSRFKFSEVLSSQSFSSGRHMWEVDVKGSANWGVGMCYPSVDRNWKNKVDYINNRPEWEKHYDKYWVLNLINKHYSIPTKDGYSQSYGKQLYPRIRMYLDYEAGQISFYEPTVPVRHLHTFTTTFTEPLHVVIGVWDDFNYIKLCGGGGSESKALSPP